MFNIVDDQDIGIERMELGPYGTNAYIIVCRKTGDSLVVDAPGDASEIIGGLKGTQPRYILLSHDHLDHTGVLDLLRSQLKIPLATHLENSSRLEKPPEILLKDGESLSLGKLTVEVLHTPGHTPGSLCFKIGKILIAGDTIFPGGPGKTNSPGNFRQILASITEKIFKLPDDTVLYPGHGPETTVEKAKEEYAVFASRSHKADLCGDVLWLSS
ncbi:MAG: MBL fold metallo-hydrolase [Deltaproteobacteria bacterium]|nr:MBL fold metallo-hydrolase [Deltaproteobacteria bacterium]